MITDPIVNKYVANSLQEDADIRSEGLGTVSE